MEGELPINSNWKYPFADSVATRPPILASPINSLPLELLERVFSLCAEHETEPSVLSFITKTLPAASVVSGGWRYAAQRVLWRNVMLGSERQAKRFLESAGTKRFRVESLHIRSSGGTLVGNKAAKDVLAALMDGLIELKLGSFKNLEFAALETPNLAGLKKLTLHASFAYRYEPVSLPFTLTHLSLHHHRQPSSLLTALFSSPSPLPSLLLRLDSEPLHNDQIFSHFPPASRHLVHLSFAQTLDTPFPPDFIPLFQRCFALSHLSFTEGPTDILALVDILQVLPTPLVSLGVVLPDEDEAKPRVLASLWEMLEFDSMSELREWRMATPRWHRKTLEYAKVDGMATLLSRCEARGIKAIVGPVTD